LRWINLEFQEGDFVTIMGPSGAGKSTLLSILGMYDHVWEGEYHLFGDPVHKLTAKDRAAQQTPRRICFPAISSPRRPDRRRKSGYTAFLSEHQSFAAAINLVFLPRAMTELHSTSGPAYGATVLFVTGFAKGSADGKL